MLSYLALGDSYTIAEGCALHESFPYQTVQLLRSNGFATHPPEIVARTGWTTTELLNHLEGIMLNNAYDVVSLLIGVNNQYRQLSVEQYGDEFQQLLHLAVQKAGDQVNNVFVLSIPDWGLTPFAQKQDSSLITKEIALFNEMNLQISRQSGVHYVDITNASPEVADHPEYFAGDGLHPSAKAYKRWSKLLTDKVISVIK